MNIKIQSITPDSRDYPVLLKKIYDPPKTLFYKGTLPKEDRVYLAVIGSRKMTPYGKSALEKILPPIVRAGVGIVSGLAYGIDAEALKITLANNGFACGVIGSGLDDASFYPKVNIPLANEMVEKGGLLLSEYTERSTVLPRNFARRNRSIAGMCHGVLIVEAAAKSGSLITAEVAMNENREVFAIPNTIFHRGSDGTNNLLKTGAHMVTEAQDILSVFGISDNFINPKDMDSYEGKLLTLLSSEPLHIDELSKTLHLTPSETSARLSQLEIIGAVKNIGGMNYVRSYE